MKCCDVCLKLWLLSTCQATSKNFHSSFKFLTLFPTRHSPDFHPFFMHIFLPRQQAQLVCSNNFLIFFLSLTSFAFFHVSSNLACYDGINKTLRKIIVVLKKKYCYKNIRSSKLQHKNSCFFVFEKCSFLFFLSIFQHSIECFSCGNFLQLLCVHLIIKTSRWRLCCKEHFVKSLDFSSNIHKHNHNKSCWITNSTEHHPKT